MQATLSSPTHGPEEQEGKMHGSKNGLIKFMSTNKGMTYPIIQPGKQGHSFPAPARKHTNLIAAACPTPIPVLVVQETGRGLGRGDGWAAWGVDCFALDR